MTIAVFNNGTRNAGLGAVLDAHYLVEKTAITDNGVIERQRRGAGVSGDNSPIARCRTAITARDNAGISVIMFGSYNRSIHIIAGAAYSQRAVDGKGIIAVHFNHCPGLDNQSIAHGYGYIVLN